MIDWARLDTLRDDVGADGFDEIVALFLEEIEEGIARLRVGPEKAALDSELHFLKGCALNLGFGAFSALCQHGENQCANGQAEQVDIAAILGCYHASHRAFLNGPESP